MPIDPDLFEQHRKLADQINAEVLANPQSPYAGKFIGLANGRVVAVADNLDEIDDALERIESDPDKTFYFEAGIDYGAVEYIWETR